MHTPQKPVPTRRAGHPRSARACGTSSITRKPTAPSTTCAASSENQAPPPSGHTPTNYPASCARQRHTYTRQCHDTEPPTPRRSTRRLHRMLEPNTYPHRLPRHQHRGVAPSPARKPARLLLRYLQPGVALRAPRHPTNHHLRWNKHCWAPGRTRRSTHTRHA